MKKLTDRPNDVSGIIWAHFLCCRFPEALENMNSTLIYLLVLIKHKIKYIKNLLMAQMTHLASFGPIFITCLP